MCARYTVTIFQYRLLHYRIAFFERLRELCGKTGVRIRLVVGQPSRSESVKADMGTLPWAEPVRNWYLPIKERKDICWQPSPPGVKDSALVIVMQENRLLANYWWLLRRRLGGPAVAFWGHGRDFQSRRANTLRGRWKKRIARLPDWWFAYTPLTMQVLAELGYPAERTTCVNNAMDTSALQKAVALVTDAERDEIRVELGLEKDARLGIFCGSLYPEKRLDLLFEACDVVRRECPDFRLIVLGDGSLAGYVRKACRSRPWAQWVGAKRGREKAAFLSMSDVMLNPGAVGLNVLDSFAAGVPMVTVADSGHGPEIAYLESGINGIATNDSVAGYAAAVSALLKDRHSLDELRANALQAAGKYNIDDMASRFHQGIMRCLSSC